DIISGATVTLLVIGDSINRSAQIVARHLRIGQPASTAPIGAPAVEERVLDMDVQDTASWAELLESGAVGRLHVTVGDVNARFAESNEAAANRPEPGEPEDTFIDLYAAVVSVPAIGRSLLGDSEYEYLTSRLQPGQHAILVAGNGTYSFKGSGYVR